MKKASRVYLVYGVQIPDRYGHVIQESLQAIGRRYGVAPGFLKAGSRSGPDLFLTTHGVETESGKPERLGLDKFVGGDYVAWNQTLSIALNDLGIGSTEKPGWILIADEDG